MNPTGDTPEVEVVGEPAIVVDPGNKGSRTSPREENKTTDDTVVNEDGQIRYDGGPIPRRNK